MGNKQNKGLLKADYYKKVPDDEKKKMIAEFLFMKNHEENQMVDTIILQDVYEDLTGESFFDRQEFADRKKFLLKQYQEQIEGDQYIDPEQEKQ